jgi:hypothetical protein
MFMERCSAEDGVVAADGAEGAVVMAQWKMSTPQQGPWQY